MGNAASVIWFQGSLLRVATATSPMLTFASFLGRHFCECQHQRTTKLMLMELWI